MSKPILCLDFDGVIHSYKSGWKGARNISDPPVPDALKFITNIIRDDIFELHIYSARSNQWGGRRAMKQWLCKEFALICLSPETTPDWFMKWLAGNDFALQWKDETKLAIWNLVRKIKFPKCKPPAFLTIDDRAWTFTGKFPDFLEIHNFKPWYK